ncbi:hypothetical protein HPULCUR_001813 [Helicostylum pulchrum]|uniref:Uncharacterized protein n=1 Tax=Helicostylum pulchrum TaxID=562976 RepID=A0ABP9XNT0_9FUNG
MVTKEIANNSNDFWIGDVVRTSCDQQQMYIIVSFFTVDSQIFISGFPMEFFENFQAAAFGSEKVNVPVSNIEFCMSITELRDQCQQQLSSKLICSDGEICYTPFNQLLTPHYNLIAESLAIREPVPHIAPNRQMTVRVVPISLFSDGTSGNTTKKWNCYDSCIMAPAALPLKDRNMHENQFFLCTHHNLNAMDTASRLVEDLKSLEDGMVMYDLEYDEEVLVYAPVLFITGDNVRHSEICCSKGSRSTCPCRKCFWQLDPPQPKNRPITPVRTRLQDYVAAPRFKMYSVMYAIDELPKLPAPGVTLRNRGRGVGRNPNESTPGQEDAWDKLGYKKTGGEVFLQLKAFDPTKDTPVEMLHYMEASYLTDSISILS